MMSLAIVNNNAHAKVAIETWRAMRIALSHYQPLPAATIVGQPWNTIASSHVGADRKLMRGRRWRQVESRAALCRRP